MRNSPLLFAIFVCFAFGPLAAQAQQVNLAGFAFAGQAAEAPQRFQYAFKVIEGASAESATGPTAISRLVVARSRGVSNGSFQLTFNSLGSLRDSDQALVAALVLTGETVFVENFGEYHKVFVNLRGDALIFDYKSKTVVRSYPISTILLDAPPLPPTQAQLEAHVSRLLVGGEETSLVGQFVRLLSTATLPAPGKKTVQVRTAEINDNVLALLPAALRDPGLARSLLIDAFESSLSAKTGAPLIPSRVTHSTGVMHVRFEDMYNYELKVPEGDYVFDINLKRLAKIKHSSNNVGTSYIFGAYVDLEFSEPLIGLKFFSSELKNGETAVVLKGRQEADDFPAYEDAIRGLFRKFGEAVSKSDLKWLRSASAAPDVDVQIRKTKEVIEDSKR